MKGLYLNIKVNTDNLNEKLSYTDLTDYGLTGGVVYSPEDWSQRPAVSIGNTSLIVSGWFVFSDKLNPINELLTAYLERGIEVFNEIELGNFVMLVKRENDFFLVNDLVGLSTHYWTVKDKALRVAPSLAELRIFNEEDEGFTEILSAQGHLFDNYTCLKNTFRFSPGSTLDCLGDINSYCDLPAVPIDKKLADVPAIIKDIVEKWPLKRRALAISGGLDSRLMLASSTYQFGYTYGPDNSGDRVIARVFSDCFSSYFEYSIQDALNNAERKSSECEYFFKYSSKWINGLMEAYDTARRKSGSADVLFDGYLGDVFQRGNYIRFGGFIGSLLKMFPFIYSVGFSARYILKKRYKALNDEQFEQLMHSFEQRTKDLTLDDYQKVTYYELFYGRGGRYVVNGGNITANQLFSVVPVFMSRTMLGLLLKSDLKDAVCFRNVSQVWADVGEEYKNIRADSGISPTTPPLLAPFVNVGYRFLLRYAPWMSNYGDELKKIKLKP